MAETLRHHVSSLYGVLGDANMQYVHDYVALGGAYYGACDERAATMMGVGASQLSGKVTAVTVTHGPGFTNTITSLVEAARGRTPLVLLTGDTPAVHDYVQVIDIAALVAPTGALFRRVLAPEHTSYDIAAAFRQAEASRLPVVLDIPIRLIGEDAGNTPEPYEVRFGQAVGPDLEVLDEALGIIASASRPVIVAGRGAASTAAQTAIRRLGEVIGAPVGTTLMGRDLFREDPWDLGIVGTLSNEIASETVAASDCIIAFGASLNKYTSSYGALQQGRPVIHVDIDSARFGRWTPLTVGVVGDCGIVAQSMIEQLEAADHRPSTFRSPELAARLAANDPRAEFRDTSSEEFVDARTAMIRLNELLPADRQVVTDVARFAAAPWRYLHVQHPSKFTQTANFGSIGLGFPAAVGASTTDTSCLTVAVAGDGGTMMSVAEISTAVRYELPMVFVIVNDNCYGAEWNSLQNYGIDPKFSLIEWPSFEEMGRAMGAHAITVRKESELDQVADHVAQGNLPLVVDLRIDPSVDIGSVR